MLRQILQVHKFGERLWFQISEINRIKQLGASFANRSFCDRKKLSKFPIAVPFKSRSEILNKPITKSSAALSLAQGLLRTPPDLNARQYPAQTPCIAQTRQIE
jgi:hypothetical protein